MLPLPYVHTYEDRHGKTRRYFRRRGYKKAPLPGEIGSDEFMQAYQDALAGKPVQKRPIGIDRTVEGTINALAVAYYEHADYLTLADSTKAFYRNLIENIRKEHGDKRVSKLSREPIERMLAKKAKTPAAANNWLRVIHLLMQFAVARNMRADDPTASIKKLRIRSDGFNIWPQVMIERFRARHAIGTKPRLAMELLYNTIQRRGDAIRLGPQHIRSEVLSILQQKTGTPVDIPVLPELREVLDASPISHLTFLTTEYGKPFTAAGFGGWFRDRCNEAGVPVGYSAHGLRKAGATRFAEAGFTDHEIMAWGGWKTLGEVQRYTKAANRIVMAKSGAEKLNPRTSNG